MFGFTQSTKFSIILWFFLSLTCVLSLSLLHTHTQLVPLSLCQTYIGSILVAVNPYKMFNIYGTDHVLKYEGNALGENPPWVCHWLQGWSGGRFNQSYRNGDSFITLGSFDSIFWVLVAMRMSSWSSVALERPTVCLLKSQRFGWIISQLLLSLLNQPTSVFQGICNYNSYHSGSLLLSVRAGNPKQLESINERSSLIYFYFNWQRLSKIATR